MKSCKVRRVAIVAVAAIIAVILLSLMPVVVAHAEGGQSEEQSGEQALTENIDDVLEGLDLSALDRYLDEHSDSYLFNFGDNAESIVRYLLEGNAGVDYGSYITQLLSVVFSDVVSLLPAFAEAVAVGLLCIVFAGADGLLGKTTSRVVRLAGYSLIIVIISAAFAGVAEQCISCVDNLKQQIDIITPILITLTVLTGGEQSAAVYQPSVIFLSNGAVEIVAAFIFPAAIAAAVLNFMSKVNPQISFTGMAQFVKSIMKWVLGVTVTVFSIFLTVQSVSSSLFDGVLFKTTKYILGNSVPIVGNFISGGFDLVTAAGLLIKNSVGIAGILLVIGEIAGPLVLLVAFTLLLRLAGALLQAAGDKDMFKLFSDLASDSDYFIAGLAVVAFMYAFTIMMVISSAGSFI